MGYNEGVLPGDGGQAEHRLSGDERPVERTQVVKTWHCNKAHNAEQLVALVTIVCFITHTLHSAPDAV